MSSLVVIYEILWFCPQLDQIKLILFSCTKGFFLNWIKSIFFSCTKGFDHCVKLQELSLENNCISKLEGISKLTQLKRLCLGNNLISTLENTGIHYLVQLTYLSLEGNRLSSLLGLQKMSTLVELYVGNNIISSVREIFYLKVSYVFVCFTVKCEYIPVVANIYIMNTVKKDVFVQ